jgi:hypothetical protein
LTKKVRFLWLAVATLLATDAAAVRHVGGADAPPSFSRGGSFVAAGTPGRPYPYTLSDEAAAAAASGAATTATPDALGSTTTTSLEVAAAGPTAPRATVAAAGTSSGAGAPAASPSPGAGGGGGSATAPSTETAALHLPAAGRYTFRVDGTEGASGFGNRSYPEEMTADVHGGDGLAPNETVLDLHFSDDHEERLILAVDGAGLSATYEGGSITFGPGTQTSEADYRPPMLLVPADAGDRPSGTATKGTSEARSGDQVTRVEDWTVTSFGTEVLDVGGQPTTTWVVKTERQSRPGSSDQVHRVRTAWYDPARGLWVRWTEHFDGYRSTFGVRFEYSSEYTATLAG